MALLLLAAADALQSARALPRDDRGHLRQPVQRFALQHRERVRGPALGAGHLPLVRAVRPVPFVVVHRAAPQPRFEPRRLLAGAVAAHLLSGALPGAAARPRRRPALLRAGYAERAHAGRRRAEAAGAQVRRAELRRLRLRRARTVRAVRRLGGAHLSAAHPRRRSLRPAHRLRGNFAGSAERRGHHQLHPAQSRRHRVQAPPRRPGRQGVPRQVHRLPAIRIRAGTAQGVRVRPDRLRGSGRR